MKTETRVLGALGLAACAAFALATTAHVSAQDKPTGEGVAAFAVAESNFIGAGTLAGFSAASGKTASCPVAQTASHQEAFCKKFI